MKVMFPVISYAVRIENIVSTMEQVSVPRPAVCPPLWVVFPPPYVT